jgi:hypothetical protein
MLIELRNEILSFTGKWIEMENILLAVFRKPKAAWFISHVEYRPHTNTSNIM